MRRGLLIVDAQPECCSPALAECIAGFARAHPELSRWATRFCNLPGSLYRTQLDFQQAGGATRLYPEIMQLHPRLLDKTGYGLPERAWQLQGLDEVLVCGVDTDAGVTACALGLWDRGIVPVILADLCTTSAGKASHRAALKALARQLGEHNVRSAAEAG